MKKAILAVLAVLMLVPVVFAANGIDATSISTSLTKSSGTATGSFNLTNTVSGDILVSFNAYTLETSLGSTITINSIVPQTVLAGQSKTVSFAIPIGTNSPGTYNGALNITNSSNNFRFDTMPVTLVVGSNQNFTLNKQTATINVNPGSSASTTIGIVNNGNVDTTVSTITFNSGNFQDSDGNPIAVTLSQSSNIVVTKGQTSTITISAQAPAGTKAGTYSGTVTVTGAVQKTFNLSVSVRSVLRISDIEITSPNDDEEVSRGEEVEVDVEYKNYASNIDIEDIDVEVTILDGSSPLEDDDGDDLEEKESVPDLDDGEDDQVSFTFKIPYDINDGDDYDVLVEISGENADDPSQNFYHNDTVRITAVIETHDIEIYKAEFDSSTVVCGDRNVRLSVGVRNIGDKDEDIELIVKNSDLNIEEISFFTLENNFRDEDDYTETQNYAFPLEDVKAGPYNFYIEAYYDSGDEKKLKILPLTVSSCTTTQTTQTQITPPVEVVYTTQTTSTPSTSVSSTAPMSLTDTSSSNDGWKIAGLVVVFGALAGVIVGVVIKLLGTTTIKGYK
ncbi:hypothetical protein ACFLZ7_01095 [Nanoarchaeota archaeon]